MKNDDGLDQAAEYAESAMRLMSEHKVAKTPENFEIWYTHASGRNDRLSKTLDILVSNNQPFTPEQNQSLYDEYLTENSAASAVATAGEAIKKSIGTVLGFLKEASSGADTYSESLENNLGNMARADDLDALRRAVESLVSDTKDMQAQNALLKSRLEKSSGEIRTLRQNLENSQKDAMTDALTGIANRKYFDTCLRQEAADVMESGDSLCLMLGDIDHFKKFNDNYGHQVGDQVLKLVGMILRQATEDTDNITPARYGGEEFAIVMPRVDIDWAQSFAEKIRTTVASKRIRKKATGEDFGNITMSMGVAVFKPGEPLPDLIQRADQGLYHAKATGRNRVVTEQELERAELEG
ncbi:MAG: diguanylate cyclase [Alphaproteobacteria bacterium]